MFLFGEQLGACCLLSHAVLSVITVQQHLHLAFRSLQLRIGLIHGTLQLLAQGLASLGRLFLLLNFVLKFYDLSVDPSEQLVEFLFVLKLQLHELVFLPLQLVILTN